MPEDRTSQSGMFWRIPFPFFGRIKTDGLLLRRIFTKLAQPFAQHPDMGSQENASLLPGTYPAHPLAAETRSGN